jgi:ribosomal protein L12E/L44/L45/RPP1/RPP2
MALAPVIVRIPTLTQAEPIVDAAQKPTTYFLRTLNGILQNLGKAVVQLQQLPIIQQALVDLDLATQAANEQAALAAAAAAAASTAAANSQAAADASAAATAANAREASLQASYIDPAAVLNATPALITIAPHDRIYPGAAGGPATTVAVSGGTVGATAPDDVDYVFYLDAARVGGSVTYQVSTEPPVQTGDTHVVGAVTIPLTGTADGGEGPRRPGYVESQAQTP